MSRAPGMAVYWRGCLLRGQEGVEFLSHFACPPLPWRRLCLPREGIFSSFAPRYKWAPCKPVAVSAVSVCFPQACSSQNGSSKLRVSHRRKDPHNGKPVSFPGLEKNGLPLGTVILSSGHPSLLLPLSEPQFSHL